MVQNEIGTEVKLRSGKVKVILHELSNRQRRMIFRQNKTGKRLNTQKPKFQEWIRPKRRNSSKTTGYIIEEAIL